MTALPLPLPLSIISCGSCCCCPLRLEVRWRQMMTRERRVERTYQDDSPKETRQADWLAAFSATAAPHPPVAPSLTLRGLRACALRLSHGHLLPPASTTICDSDQNFRMRSVVQFAPLRVRLRLFLGLQRNL